MIQFENDYSEGAHERKRGGMLPRCSGTGCISRWGYTALKL